MSASAYVSILDAFNQLSIYAQAIVTSAQTGATVGSVRINTHKKVAGLDAGVLPYDNDEFTVTLGSTQGSFPITTTSANAGVARLAEYARTLSESAFPFHLLLRRCTRIESSSSSPAFFIVQAISSNKPHHWTFNLQTQQIQPTRELYKFPTFAEIA